MPTRNAYEDINMAEPGRGITFVFEYSGPEEGREQAEKDLQDPVKWAQFLEEIRKITDPSLPPLVIEKLFMKGIQDPSEKPVMTDADLVWEAASSKHFV